MKNKIRQKDTKLVNILEIQLKEYLLKPVPQEKLEDIVSIFMYHIRKNSRRAENLVYVSDEMYWDKSNEMLIYKDREIILTKKERDFLALLFENVNQGIGYSVICLTLWEDIYAEKQDRIKTIVKQLRKKLPKNIIKNIHGYGYRLELETKDSN
jgi:DNA-binding response OmpR family regulator